MEDEVEQFDGWLRARLGSRIGIAVAPLDRSYPLWPEEESHVAGAVVNRRLEFSIGRWCARRALSECGFAPQAIPVGERREPLWPAGACGSITHAGGLCAAVAASSRDFAGLGIDIIDLAEAQSRLGPAASVFAAQPEIATARAALASSGEEAHALGLLFSAKESAIKAMSARFDRFLEFTEVTIRFDGTEFTAQCPPFGSHAKGWWAVQGRYGYTAAMDVEN